MAEGDPSAVIQALSDVYVLTTLSEMQKNLPELALQSTTSSSQCLVCFYVLSNSTISTACSTALLVYDTLLTLPSEIRYIWCKTIKIGAILYLLARYLPLVVYLILIYSNFSNVSPEVYSFYGSLDCHLYWFERVSSMLSFLTKKEPRDSYIWRKCNTMIHLMGALQIPFLIGIQGKWLYTYIPQVELLTQFASPGLLLARTYAISSRNQRALVVLGMLMLVVIVTDVVCSPSWLYVNNTNSFHGI
jgi:hypothetical protein